MSAASPRMTVKQELRSKVQALECEVARLKDENERLQGKVATSAPSTESRRGNRARSIQDQ